MRVISGSVGGLKLKAPEGLETRPTTDRIKESLFNIIAPEIYDTYFLDIFSGSGGIGIEALSRGASFAVFIDNSRKSADIIRSNLKAAKFEEKAELLNTDAQRALKVLSEKNMRFDIIFMDPPYSKGLTEKTLSALEQYKLLKETGFIIAEQSREEPQEYTGQFEVFRVKDYKRTSKMTFYRWRRSD